MPVFCWFVTSSRQCWLGNNRHTPFDLPPFVCLCKHPPVSQRGRYSCVFLLQHNIEAPTNTRSWTNIGLMLAHRLQRWPSIKPTLVQRLWFVSLVLTSLLFSTFCVHRRRLSFVWNQRKVRWFEVKTRQELYPCSRFGKNPKLVGFIDKDSGPTLTFQRGDRL